MKKTLILAGISLYAASFAVAGSTSISSATDGTNFLATHLYQDLNITSTTTSSVDISSAWTAANANDTDKNFAVTATLNVNVLKDYIGSSATKSFTNIFFITTESQKLGVAIGTSGSNSGIVGSYYHTDNGWQYTCLFDEYATDTQPHLLSSLDLTGVTAAAVTMSANDMNGVHAFLTLVKGDTTTYYGYASNLKWSSSGYGDLTNLTFDTSLVTSISVMPDRCTGNVYHVNATAIAAVPEPASATLSLLALAGLAARRRRK